MMENKSSLLILLLPTLVLLVPLGAMQITDDVAWGFSDFAVAWVLMTSVGFTYKWLTKQRSDHTYRLAAGLALSTVFILIWGNLAVGLIGSEDNPANLMYWGVLVVGLSGAALARGEPNGMARALFVTAFAQALVPVLTLVIWKPAFSSGMLKAFAVNTFFVLLFVSAGLLFRHAARQGKKARTSATV